MSCCYPIPTTCTGWSYPTNLAPLHKFWGDRHTDIDFDDPPMDGSIAVYSAATQKWIITGANDTNIGLFTKPTNGNYNITLGFNAAVSEQTKATSVLGSSNVFIGTTVATGSVVGSNNIAFGTYAGLALNSNTICIGQFAGSSTTDPYVTAPILSGSNNIYLNASGTALHTTESGRFYVKPVRVVQSTTGTWPTFIPTDVVPLGLNTVTNEIIGLQDGV